MTSKTPGSPANPGVRGAGCPPATEIEDGPSAAKLAVSNRYGTRHRRRLRYHRHWMIHRAAGGARRKKRDLSGRGDEDPPPARPPPAETPVVSSPPMPPCWKFQSRRCKYRQRGQFKSAPAVVTDVAIRGTAHAEAAPPPKKLNDRRARAQGRRRRWVRRQHHRRRPDHRIHHRHPAMSLLQYQADYYG